jgi:uncharacterized protein YndB with AHSA1/START domain
MPLEFIRLSTPLPVPAARVYAAWLDGDEHTRMTGGTAKATVDPRVGGFHTAWGGYIGGQILALEPEQRIVVSWRSSEFPPEHPHSRLEIRLRDVPGGCELALAHSDIPEGQGEQYAAGWQDHYFIPMMRYFRAVPEAPVKPKPLAKAKAKAKRVAKKTADPARAKKVAKKTAKPARAKKTTRAKPAAQAKRQAKKSSPRAKPAGAKTKKKR